MGRRETKLTNAFFTQWETIMQDFHQTIWCCRTSTNFNQVHNFDQFSKNLTRSRNFYFEEAPHKEMCRSFGGCEGGHGKCPLLKAHFLFLVFLGFKILTTIHDFHLISQCLQLSGENKMIRRTWIPRKTGKIGKIREARWAGKAKEARKSEKAGNTRKAIKIGEQGDKQSKRISWETVKWWNLQTCSSHSESLLMQIAIQLFSGKDPEKYDPCLNNICRLLDNRWTANDEAQMYKVANSC